MLRTVFLARSITFACSSLLMVDIDICSDDPGQSTGCCWRVRKHRVKRGLGRPLLTPRGGLGKQECRTHAFSRWSARIWFGFQQWQMHGVHLMEGGYCGILPQITGVCCNKCFSKVMGNFIDASLSSFREVVMGGGKQHALVPTCERVQRSSGSRSVSFNLSV